MNHDNHCQHFGIFGSRVQALSCHPPPAPRPDSTSEPPLIRAKGTMWLGGASMSGATQGRSMSEAVVCTETGWGDSDEGGEHLSPEGQWLPKVQRTVLVED